MLQATRGIMHSSLAIWEDSYFVHYLTIQASECNVWVKIFTIISSCSQLSVQLYCGCELGIYHTHWTTCIRLLIKSWWVHSPFLGIRMQCLSQNILRASESTIFWVCYLHVISSLALLSGRELDMSPRCDNRQSFGLWQNGLSCLLVQQHRRLLWQFNFTAFVHSEFSSRIWIKKLQSSTFLCT